MKRLKKRKKNLISNESFFFLYKISFKNTNGFVTNLFQWVLRGCPQGQRSKAHGGWKTWPHCSTIWWMCSSYKVLCSCFVIEFLKFPIWIFYLQNNEWGSGWAIWGHWFRRHHPGSKQHPHPFGWRSVSIGKILKKAYFILNVERTTFFFWRWCLLRKAFIFWSRKLQNRIWKNMGFQILQVWDDRFLLYFLII